MQDGPNNPFMPGGEYENTDKESTFTRMDKVLEDFKLELQKAQENNDVAKIQELIEEIELQKQSIDDLLEALSLIHI